jgi:hypothetical protein
MNNISPQLLIPVPRTEIRGNDIANVTTVCMIKCRPRFLYIPSRVAHDFEIINIMIGKNSQTASLGEIPAAAFAGELDINLLTGDIDMRQAFKNVLLDHPVPVLFDDCERGTFITLMLRNLNQSARNFTALFYGESLE